MSNNQDYHDDNRRFYDHRLIRIEEKIDEFGKILVSIARTEEKVSSMEEDKTMQWEKLNKLESKIDIMEQKINDAAKVVGVIHKVFWLAIAGTVTYFIPTFLESIPV